jgi:IS66 Orf2 like protein
MPMNRANISDALQAYGQAAAMIPVPSGARVWLASGHTDMRKGFDGLALLIQEIVAEFPDAREFREARNEKDPPTLIVPQCSIGQVANVAHESMDRRS